MTIEPEVSSASAARESPVMIIRAREGWQPADLLELWRFRGLAWILALRDVKVRYKQTAIGAAWAVLQPLTTALIFYLLFHVIAGRADLGQAGVPYFVSTYCALLPWQLFASSLAQAGESLIANQGLINKIYFPRLLLPIAPVIGGLVDFAVGLVPLFIMMLACGIAPGWQILTAPLFVMLAILTALSVGVWLAALCAMYRDFRYTIAFLMQIWFFATPVVYSATVVTGAEWSWKRTLFGLNPMAGVIEGFRWAFLNTGSPPGPLLAVSVIVMIVLLVTGLWYFRKMERNFADWV